MDNLATLSRTKSISFNAKKIIHSESLHIKTKQYNMQIRFDSEPLDIKRKEELDSYLKSIHDKNIKITIEVLD